MTTSNILSEVRDILSEATGGQPLEEGKYSVYTGPTTVKHVAKELRKLKCVSDVIEGTEKVIFSCSSKDDLYDQASPQLMKYLRKSPGMPGGLRTIRESLDPLREDSAQHYEAAAKLIDEGPKAMKTIEAKLKAVDEAFKNAKKRQERMMKIGVGRTESVTLLEPVVEELREFANFVTWMADFAVKKTGIREGVEFRQQGNGLWEDPVMEAGKSVPHPNNSMLGPQSANVAKSVGALMSAQKGSVVKMGGRAYKVTQAAVPLPGNAGHVVVLSGASGGGMGSQYMALIPPSSGGGMGGSVKLVAIDSANPVFRDLNPAAIESVQESDDLYWAGPRLDESQVWVSADVAQFGRILSAAFRGPELRYHLEAAGDEPEFVTEMRRIVIEGFPMDVSGVQVQVHEAANAIQVYDGLGIENQRKVASMGPRRMLDVIAKMQESKRESKRAGRKTNTVDRWARVGHGMVGDRVITKTGELGQVVKIERDRPVVKWDEGGQETTTWDRLRPLKSWADMGH